MDVKSNSFFLLIASPSSTLVKLEFFYGAAVAGSRGSGHGSFIKKGKLGTGELLLIPVADQKCLTEKDGPFLRVRVFDIFAQDFMHRTSIQGTLPVCSSTAPVYALSLRRVTSSRLGVAEEGEGESALLALLEIESDAEFCFQDRKMKSLQCCRDCPLRLDAHRAIEHRVPFLQTPKPSETELLLLLVCQPFFLCSPPPAAARCHHSRGHLLL